MSIQDHTTAADGQTLAGQDWATQQTFVNTWGSSWAPVRWVLEHNHTIGQGDAPPVVSPQDAINSNLPGGTPCAGGSQCASGVCNAPTYLCATAQIDKSKIDPKLQNPGVVPTDSQLTKGPNQTAGSQPFDLGQWASQFTIVQQLFGAQAPQISNGMLAAGAGALVLLLGRGGGHHRGGLL